LSTYKKRETGVECGPAEEAGGELVLAMVVKASEKGCGGGARHR